MSSSSLIYVMSYLEKKVKYRPTFQLRSHIFPIIFVDSRFVHYDRIVSFISRRMATSSGGLAVFKRPGINFPSRAELTTGGGEGERWPQASSILFGPQGFFSGLSPGQSTTVYNL